MAEIMENPAPENVRKRSLPDDDEVSIAKSESLPTPPLTASPANQDANRQPSPAPSTSTLSSAPSGANDQPVDPNAPPKKRRKFTPAEKEEQRLAKEQKDRERAEAKQKRDEEKRRKNEEKEAKQREKDLKKAKEEEEKMKKARAQPKIASFFKTPSQKSPATPAKVQPSPIRQESSLSQTHDGDISMTSPTPQKTPQKSDYLKTFLPFQLKSHTTCAPSAPLLRPDEMHASQLHIDQVLERVAKNERITASPASSLSTLFADERARSRGLWQPTAREVIESLHGSSQTPIDLTDETGEHYRPTDLLNSLTVRHLHFGEDVRPAYFGTYSRKVPISNASKMRKNPFSRLREDTNYDYDSEAEWEEPEEGEDILSDGEEEEESVGDAEEMEEFLDDDAADHKRHIITGDLKPVSTGLCWEDVKGVYSQPTQEPTIDLDSMKIDFFIPLSKPSINPFSAAYWQTAPTSEPTASKLGSAQTLLDGKMKPPRNPLLPRSNTNDTLTIIGASSGMKGPIMGVVSGKAAKPAPKPLQGSDLVEFKDAVEGSNLTKNDLQKALKKRFPKHTNDTIKATLSSCFARIGQHEADKVWKAIGA